MEKLLGRYINKDVFNENRFIIETILEKYDYCFKCLIIIKKDCGWYCDLDLCEKYNKIMCVNCYIDEGNLFECYDHTTCERCNHWYPTRDLYNENFSLKEKILPEN